MDYRIEHDSMGEMKVPADRLWGAQTQRSHENFEIGVDIETMPREVTHAFGILKKAAAMVMKNWLTRRLPSTPVTSPTSRPQTPAHRASGTLPPKNRQKPKAPRK